MTLFAFLTGRSDYARVEAVNAVFGKIARDVLEGVPSFSVELGGIVFSREAGRTDRTRLVQPGGAPHRPGDL